MVHRPSGEPDRGYTHPPQVCSCFMNPQSYTPHHQMPHATHRSSNPEYDDWVDFEEVFVDYENGPPLKIRREITDECYQKANSKVNLAVQLVKSVLQKRKCYIKLFRRSPFWQEAICNSDDGSEGCTLRNIPSSAFRKGGYSVERIQDSKDTLTHVLRYCICIYNSLSLSYTMSLFYYVNLY